MEQIKTSEHIKNIEYNKAITYNIGLDILRIFAMFFVILVHSTSFYGFGRDISNPVIAITAGISRYISFSCVPLFIILTGYLNFNKTPSFKYYFKLLKFLLEFYLCATVVAIIYN